MSKRPSANNPALAGGPHSPAESGFRLPGSGEDFVLVDDTAPVAGDSDLGPRGLLGKTWKVLVVDDDDDVHQATTFTLRRAEVLGRPIELLHAFSAREGIALLKREPDVAVALVDVVMETPDAGLHLVQEVRLLGIRTTRLILRTGQPGYAPELTVMQQYDINDYRTKTELTTTRLLSALTAAIRSYHHLVTVERWSAGLRLVVQGVAELFTQKTLDVFARGILTQLARLLDVPASGVVCVAPRTKNDAATFKRHTIVSAAGAWNGTLGESLASVSDNALWTGYASLAATEETRIAAARLLMRVNSARNQQMLIVIEGVEHLSEADLSLLEVFRTNTAISFDNIQLIERLDHLAYVDEQLNMPNDHGFERYLQTQLRARPAGCEVAVIRIAEMDLYASAYGGEQARKILSRIHNRAADRAPAIEMIARLGENLLAVLYDPERITAPEVHQAFSGPLTLDTLSLNITSTMAYCPAAANSGGATERIRDARAALLQGEATQTGSLSIYNSDIAAGVTSRLRIQSALRHSLASGDEFWVALQAKIDMEHGHIVGAEALARWTHEGQPLSPAQFIPIIESSGLSRLLRDRLIEEIGKLQAQRRTQGLPKLPIAINLSHCDIARPHFATSLLARAETVGLDTTTLQLEITESGMMENMDHALRELHILREAGMEVAIDDFGTGYSSLAYLEKLPVTTLKVDRCFVATLSIASARKSIIGTTISLADTLNLSLVAEGIETAEQHQALRFLGCPLGQGFLYTRPLSPAEFITHCSEWSLERALNGKAA